VCGCRTFKVKKMATLMEFLEMLSENLVRILIPIALTIKKKKEKRIKMNYI
jgi:hypothetical protein